MRVLVLSPSPTSPRNFGNRVRIDRVRKELKDLGHEAHLLLYPAESDWRKGFPFEQLAVMKKDWDSVNIIPVTRELHCPAIDVDHSIDEWWDDAIGVYLQWLFSKASFDIFIVNYTWLSKALEYAPTGVLRVLDTHDKFAGRRQLLESLGIAPEFFHTTEEEERIGVSRADVVVAIKAEEKAYFDQIGSRKVTTLIHADEANFLEPNSRQAELKIFGILGAYNSINVSNISRFVEAAAPIFRKYLCPLEIRIYGKVVQGLAHLKRFSFVKLVGYVEQQSDFYTDVDFVLIPMDGSTGLKIKAAEALAYGRPVIAHKHGFEGLPAFHPYHGCNDFEEVAEACITCAFEESVARSLTIATKRAQISAENSFRQGLSEIISARTDALPSKVVVFYLEKSMQDDSIWMLKDLLEYASYKYQFGVILVGQLPPNCEDILNMSGRYVKVLPDAAKLFEPDTLGWLSKVDWMLTNESSMFKGVDLAGLKSLIVDHRDKRPTTISRIDAPKCREIYVLQSTGTIPRRYRYKNSRVRELSMPRRFWKFAEPTAKSTVNYEYIESLMGSVGAVQTSLSISRSVSHDAGWAALWTRL